MIPIIDPQTESLIIEYDGLKVAKRSLTKRETELRSRLDELLERYRLDFPYGEWLSFGGAQVRFTHRKGVSSINGDKLLERGVDPEIIAYATETKPGTLTLDTRCVGE